MRQRRLDAAVGEDPLGSYPRQIKSVRHGALGWEHNSCQRERRRRGVVDVKVMAAPFGWAMPKPIEVVLSAVLSASV